MAIQLIQPPEREPSEMAPGSQLFRVGFRTHQEPPPGSGIAQEEMGWGVVWYDIRASDIHEVIEWADGKARPDQIYTLHVRFTDPYSAREWLIRVGGADPTVPDDWFDREHPVSGDLAPTN